MSSFYSGADHQPFQLGSGKIGALLIHGFPGTPAEMRPLAERLAAAGWATYGPLLPGFGPEIPTLAQKTRHDWLDAARDKWHKVQAQHDTAVLIGFSMGGALALNLAAEQPPDFLILLAPFWRFANWQGNLLPIVKYFQKAFYPFAQADFSDADVRKQLAGIMPGVNLDDTAVQTRLRQEIQLPTKTIDQVRQLGKKGGKLASSIHSPTLLLQGSKDQLVLPRISRKLITQIAGSVSYREIPGDHSFPKMQPPNEVDITPEILSFVSVK